MSGQTKQKNKAHKRGGRVDQAARSLVNSVRKGGAVRVVRRKKIKQSNNSALNTSRNQSAIGLKKTRKISKTLRNQHKLELLRKTQKALKDKIDTIGHNEYVEPQTKQAIINAALLNRTHISETRIVLLVAANQDADPSTIMQMLYDHYQPNATCHVPVLGSKAVNYLQIYAQKTKLTIISPKNRQDHQLFLDLAKAADIVCPVLSVRQCNVKGVALNPHDEGHAFDDIGYVLINMLRSVGCPESVGVIQHLEELEGKHEQKVTKLFKRFLTSEIAPENRIVTLKPGSVLTLARHLELMGIHPQAWKVSRPFILAERIEIHSPNSVTVWGQLKGAPINSNQLVHVTGFDDFQIDQVQIELHRAKQRKLNLIEEPQTLSQHSGLCQNLDPYSKPEVENDQFLTALQGLGLNEEQAAPPAELEIEKENDSDEDGYLESSSEEAPLEIKQNEKQRRLELNLRTEEELEFEDEAEYAPDEKLCEKFQQFQGLKNFKTSQWNNLQNLPDLYDRIFTFRSIKTTADKAILENQERAFAYPGMYVGVTIKDFPTHKLQDAPLLLSFLLKHERKMTVVHLKMKVNQFYTGLNQGAQEATMEEEEEKPKRGQRSVLKPLILSNETCCVSLGFKRFLTTPMFSQVISATTKTKYCKKVIQDPTAVYFCSFYHYAQLLPANALVFKITQPEKLQIISQTQAPLTVESSPLLVGELVKCDPMHIVLQRIILTGYPYKINRRRSTVRYMFFDPADIKYFKPVELVTKMGLRGHIEQSLGTHGLMKCMFNDKIKHNDTVCMHLYRRMFPLPASAPSK